MTKLAGNRSPRWALLERFEIPDYDHPERNYLTRWRIVETPWCAVYLHRMDGPDPRETLHDHPWNFTSLILKGVYAEHHRVGDRGWDVRLRAWGRWSVHRMRAEDAHSIAAVSEPTWTLLLVGRRRREWGYVEPVRGEDGWYCGARWTHSMEHPHNAEFEAAMAERR